MSNKTTTLTKVETENVEEGILEIYIMLIIIIMLARAALRTSWQLGGRPGRSPRGRSWKEQRKGV